jgi:hypothetical protein
MCGKTWREIRPEAVPGRCLKIHTKAFLNQPRKREKDPNALRYPLSDDRMECRKHFQDFIEGLKKGTKKAHGANVVLPHELVEKILNQKRYSFSDSLTDDEHALLQAQWDSIREETLKLGGLGKSVPMCDFSGSMDGLPKLISLALGILISETNDPTFKDHILSFDAKPQWHSFKEMSSLKEKVESAEKSALGYGLNTNFYLACKKIIEKMIEHKVPVGEEPEDLIVLTDMGFDSASHESSSNYGFNRKNKEWVRQLRTIQDDFREAGEHVWGKGNGWKPPRIVLWNLRAEFKDFHAKADQEGVVQLSGWSPSILKALQKGGIQTITPYQGLRAVLDDERYDPVRQVWNQVHGDA